LRAYTDAATARAAYRARMGESDLLVCDGCGDLIGVYEPAWVEHADGTLTASSRLNLDHFDRQTAKRLWHAGCIVPVT